MGANERDEGRKEGYELGIEEGYKEGYKEGLSEGASQMRQEALAKIAKYMEDEGLVSSVEEAEKKAEEVMNKEIEQKRSWSHLM